MRLLMAVSADGFLCRGPDDDMSWTGPDDKALFRALTSVGGMCAAGATTWRLMPRLAGRQLIPISRTGYTLERFQDEHPEGWLLGGPTVASAALRAALVKEVHLCEPRSGLPLRGVYLHSGVHISELYERVPNLGDDLRWPGHPALRTLVGNVLHSVYRP